MLLVRFFLPTKLGDQFRANVEFTFQHGASGIEKDIKASIYPAFIGDFNIFEPAGSTHRAGCSCFRQDMTCNDHERGCARPGVGTNICMDMPKKVP
jgi:hypothetical protein